MNLDHSPKFFKIGLCKEFLMLDLAKILSRSACCGWIFIQKEVADLLTLSSLSGWIIIGKHAVFVLSLFET